MSEHLNADMLGKKIGPLPVAGWLAAVGGGLGIAWYLRSRGINPDAADATDAGGTYDPGALGTSVTGGLGGAAVSDPYNPGNITDPVDSEQAGPGTVAITTNGQWRVQAVKYLIGHGHLGTSSEVAVGNYLAGNVMTAGQAAMINQAIAGIGPTPSAVPPIKVKSTATTTPAGSTSGGTKAPSVPKTNAEWRPHAIYWLRVHGNYGKGMSNAAATSNIDTYLHGHALTYHQAQMIKSVNAGYMPAPHPLPIKLTAAAIHYLQTAHPDARRDTGTNTNP